MSEVWKPVEWFPPYQVSDIGRVKGHRGKVLRPRPHPHGYKRIGLSVRGVEHAAYIHRLVCAAFHGPPPNEKMHADHINGDKADNRAVNLRWLSPEENRALRNIAFGSRHGSAKLTDENVRMIRAAGFARGQDAQIARTLGVSRETARDARRRKYWERIT